MGVWGNGGFCAFDVGVWRNSGFCAGVLRQNAEEFPVKTCPQYLDRLGTSKIVNRGILYFLIWRCEGVGEQDVSVLLVWEWGCVGNRGFFAFGVGV